MTLIWYLDQLVTEHPITLIVAFSIAASVLWLDRMDEKRAGR